MRAYDMMKVESCSPTLFKGEMIMELLHKDEEKIKQISSFMREILKDLSREEKRLIYEQYKPYIEQINPIDLFYLEMYNATSNTDISTIKQSANRFVNAFQSSLKAYEIKEADHPFMQALIDENNAIIKVLNDMKPYFKTGNITKHKQALKTQFEQLRHLEKKFIKKENILFPVLEDKVPSTRPLEVMWSLHDDARHQTKSLIHLLSQDDVDETTYIKAIGTYYYLLFGIIQKESLILLPVANERINKKMMDQMFKECFDYGFTFIDINPPHTVSTEDEPTLSDTFNSKTGSLTAKQLSLVFNHLPVDITFVDKEDKVRYFNDRQERHFPRSPSIIGRLVKHCHPPKSVDTVEKIVKAFKENKRDTAEFWITFKNRFLHIRYFAVRDELGRYEGVLEVSQDVTDIRTLSGERRLLDWD